MHSIDSRRVHDCLGTILWGDDHLYCDTCGAFLVTDDPNDALPLGTDAEANRDARDAGDLHSPGGWAPLAALINDRAMRVERASTSQAGIARLLGVQPNDWSRWVRGAVVPGVDKVEAWCNALGLSVAYDGGRWVVR